MLRWIVLILFLLLIPMQNLLAQSGTVQIVQDERISDLAEKYVYLNKNEKLQGYRVQIFFDSGTNSKNRAFGKKGQFLANYPDVDAYLTFQSPYYKVRVGDFRTRLDAEGFKAKIILDFTDAFVVMDEINYPKID